MENFKEITECLAREWEAQGTDDETPEELMASLQNLMLRMERARHRVEDGTPEADAVDKRTLVIIAAPDRLTGEFSLTEAFLRRLQTNPRDAYQYLSDEIQRKDAINSKRASNPRPSRWDNITKMINEFVEDDPKVSSKQVGRHLLESDQVYYLEGSYIHKFDRSEVTEGGLVKRVSRAKKRYWKNNSR